MSNLAQAERAMLRVAPHALPEAVREAVRSGYGAQSADLLLVDYRMVVLRPVLDGPSQPLSGSLAGTAFAEQRPVRDGDLLWLPMTVQGDRIGVLQVRLAASADGVAGAGAVEELAELAGAVGQALVVADQMTDRFCGVRRSQRLTLAAEIQWELLPGRALVRPEFALGGQLEPAYSVRGDTFDWTADADHLSLAVTNGMGEGVSAALLTTLGVNALRNARRAGLGLADQAALADQAVYAQYHGEAHLETLLLQLELATGRVRAVDAGSPRLMLLRGEEMTTVALEAQLPLGMFDGTVYVEQELGLEPGDRLVVLSDGVYAAAAAEVRYDAEALERILTDTRRLPPYEAVRLLLHDLVGFHHGYDLTDDAVAVCLDWAGA
jgi:hypothetical protein